MSSISVPKKLEAQKNVLAVALLPWTHSHEFVLIYKDKTRLAKVCSLTLEPLILPEKNPCACHWSQSQAQEV